VIHPKRNISEPRTSRSWQAQIKNQVRALDQLAESLAGIARESGTSHTPCATTATLGERGVPRFVITDSLRRTADRYPIAITPYYLSLIREHSPADPIYRQCIPDPAELEYSTLADDELLEDTRYSPVPGLIHRYPDRVVILTTTACPTYCRHCTRKRLLGRPVRHDAVPRHARGGMSMSNAAAQVRYVRTHPAIKDVILSGGDPLMLPDEHLDRILRAFRAIPTVQIIRVGTRAPVTLPQRITRSLCRILERHHPVWLNTQFNHPREITAESAAACDRLLRHGIPVNNQTVLLRGVNDDPDVMEDLCRSLLRIRVRPYYLLQCDPVAGIEHLRTPVSRGLEIMRELYKRIGGLGVPRYVVDAIHGGGKMPISPGYIVDYSHGALTLRSFDGRTVTYPDPSPGCSARS